MTSLALILAACASVMWSPEESQFIRYQYAPPPGGSPHGQSDVGGQKLVARGKDFAPCLEDIYRRGMVGFPKLQLEDQQDGLWAIYILRQVDPSRAMALVQQSLAALQPPDKRIVPLAVIGYQLGLQGQQGVPSATGKLLQHMDQCHDSAEMLRIIRALSLINRPDLKWAVKKRLESGIDSAEVRQALTFLFWQLDQDLDRMKTEIRTNALTSRQVADFLCNMGQSWMVADIVRSGNYPQGVDLQGVLAAARRQAADGGDELAISGSWP